jgi:hypothetical protein
LTVKYTAGYAEEILPMIINDENKNSICHDQHDRYCFLPQTGIEPVRSLTLAGFGV